MFDADVSGVFEGLGDWGGGLEDNGEVSRPRKRKHTLAWYWLP